MQQRGFFEEPEVTQQIDNANPYAMNRDELNAFLEERRFASVSTLRKDGSPIGVVLGYEWDGESMFLSVRSTRIIAKRLARDPRICITVFNNEYPPKYVIIEGVAEVIDDPGFVRTKRKALRYLAPDSPAMTLEKKLDLDEYWKGYLEVGRVAYLVKPQKLMSEDGAKWDHEKSAGAGISDAQARARGELSPGQGR
jgi:PPOX class probable F420-dependent enzyme